MWPLTFDERLVAWKSLRTQVVDLDIHDALMAINDWWFFAPQATHYLHWDEVSSWPTPWELLADNIYCELARALGIVYTILSVPDIQDVQFTMVETTQGSLVLVSGMKYILNYSPGEIVNIHTNLPQVKRAYPGNLFRHSVG